MDNTSILHGDWVILTKFLPDNWQHKAKELGALIRRRKIDNAETLLRVLLIHLADGKSFRATSAYAQEAGLCDINDAGLLHRLRAAKEWFHWLALELLKSLQTDPLPERLGGKFHLRLVDSSMISEPGPTGSLWRLHYGFRLLDFSCDAFAVTSQQEGESFCRYSVSQNDLMMGDRNYCKPRGIMHVLRNQGQVLVRFHSTSLPLLNRRGRPLSLLPLLRSLPQGSAGDWDVWFKDPEHGSLVKGRIVALRKSREAMEKSKKEIRHEASRKSRKLKSDTLEYAEYIILFTTLSRRHFSTEGLLTLYRFRWQIELIFKRLKSIVGIGHLPKRNPDSSIAWLYGKMILALLIERLTREAESFSPWGYPFGSSGGS
jgi:hypothetical protein